MKIAIFYICTGKYEMFWSRFYKECEQFFYPSIEKEYFVFTDSKSILESKETNVHPYYQVRSGWPYDTLLRFQWFLTVQDKLSDINCCYYFNANSKFLKIIDEKVIPLPTENEPLQFWCHTRHEDDYTGETFHPDRNPLSKAYVPEEQVCRCYGGGFFGGLTSAFVTMCQCLRDNIMQDMNNSYIAIWHDQSHIIKYAITNAHSEVPKGIISEEEYAYGNNLCLIFESKKKYGGNDVMRDIPLRKKYMHKIVDVCLKIVDKIKR